MKTCCSVILILAGLTLALGQGGRKVPDPSAPTVSEVSRLPPVDREKAVDLYRQGAYQDAVPFFEEVLAADKTDKEAWLYLGMSLAKTGRNDAALEAFRQGSALRVNPDRKAPAENETELKIKFKPRCNYTETARQHRVTGSVSFAVEFKGDGKIETIFPVKTLPDGLTESCIAAIKRIDFEPALKNGAPIPSIRLLTYSFSIY